MNTLLKIIIVGLCAWFVIYLDTLLYDLIINAIPQTEWLGLIKIILVIVMIVYTSGIVILLTMLASIIALGILNIILPKSGRYKDNRRLLKENSATSAPVQTDGWMLPKKKSSFQLKLEEMAKERKDKLGIKGDL